MRTLDVNPKKKKKKIRLSTGHWKLQSVSARRGDRKGILLPSSPKDAREGRAATFDLNRAKRLALSDESEQSEATRRKSEGRTKTRKKGRKKRRKEGRKEGRKRRGGGDSTRILGARARQFCGSKDAFTISDIYRTARGAFFFSADLAPTRQTPQGLSHLLLSAVLSLGINWARPVRLRGKREERENGSLVYGDGTPYPRNRMNFCLCGGVPAYSRLSFTPSCPETKRSSFSLLFSAGTSREAACY